MESDNGAKASAMRYSIVETAKANGLNTYQYLELLLTELPKHLEDKDLKFLDDLLPWSERVQKECPSKYKKYVKHLSTTAEMQSVLMCSTHG